MPDPGATIAQIRTAARRDAATVLRDYWAGDGKVDPVMLARRMGLSVFDAQLGDDTWGMIIGASGGSADIYLDVDQPPVRYRFSCAHELGHYVDNRGTLSPGEGFEDRRSEEGRGTAREVYANEFAGSLLMPEGAFRELAQSGAANPDIAREFGVSLAAVEYRRNLLGI